LFKLSAYKGGIIVEQKVRETTNGKIAEHDRLRAKSSNGQVGEVLNGLTRIT
jgi:hypothetical protein